MILITVALLLTVGAVLFTLLVRQKDLPAPEPVSPVKHLEERKATIYDNLRDLQFEYRLGKLSDGDYQQTKQDLQRELAAVMAEIDKGNGNQPAPPPAKKKTQAAGSECPHCGSKFPTELKFCGECGKAMAVEVK